MPRARPLRLGDVRRGSLILDVAGNRVGEFIGVRGEDLEVSRGPFRTRIIRAEHVGELREGVVRLAVHASELD